MFTGSQGIQTLLYYIYDYYSIYLLSLCFVATRKPNLPKDTLEFMLSLPVERKIPKVTEQETVYATAEQQAVMERPLLKE